MSNEKHPRKTPRGYYVTVGMDGVYNVHTGPQATGAGPREATAWGLTVQEATTRAFTAIGRARRVAK